MYKISDNIRVRPQKHFCCWA